ncbi:kinase-like domain-containing protein [Mycena filopes]|nr:kinase-like domain-containing protein [Mycena filopes]
MSASPSWPDRYKKHILKHRFEILDGRVTASRRAFRIGNLSDVYLGELQSSWAGHAPEKVAVKMIRGQSIEDSDFRKFLKEVYTWSKLQSDYILPMRGITVHLGGTLSIISPWMAKGSARSYVSDVHVDPGSLLHDVAAGLSYLHAKEVYHGDLKGENILISDGGRAILADFGYSILEKGSFSLPISQPTGGSPLWMAPEKLAGYGDSPAADVYSFAMVTLELFTRENPFHGETYLTPTDIQNGKRPARPAPAATVYRLTDDWWRICRRCWDNDPSKRWSVNRIMQFISQIRLRAHHAA